MKTEAEKRARVEHLLDFYSHKDANDSAAHEVCQIALEYMDEAERSNKRIKLLEARLADIVDVTTGNLVGQHAYQAMDSQPSDVVAALKVVEKAMASLQPEPQNPMGPLGDTTPDKPVYIRAKRTTPCSLQLRLLSPNQLCMDEDCGFPAKEHKNYNGDQK